MTKQLRTHASERIDQVDLDQITAYAKGTSDLARKLGLLDHQARILRGFRIELPNQTSYPGQITVHAGAALDYDGQSLFEETQLDSSRTITLEGASTDFYLEIAFVETESDLDDRAFWDPTVDQGLDTSGDALPDGQEFSNNVTTRKSAGWYIVQPVSTTGFERDQPGTVDSVKIPLAHLRTNASNEITPTVNTNLTTEKASSTMLEFISTTLIRVRNASLFLVGDTINVTDEGGTDASTISAINLETNLLTISAITSKEPGAIVRVTSASSPNFIKPEEYGRYRRIAVDAAQPNHIVSHHDYLFRGDEVHGGALARSQDSITDRSDINLQSLKDHIDFLAAQLQELKWGALSPYSVTVGADREPATSFAANPRYFDQSPGIAGSRGHVVSVGDGTNSFGDLNGTTQDVIQDAHDLLPAGVGGTIRLKRGTYTLGSNLTLNNTGTVTIEGEPGTNITVSGGAVVLSGLYRYFNNVTFTGGTSTRAISVGGPTLVLNNCTFNDCQLYASDVVLFKMYNVLFDSSAAAMATIPLIELASAGIVGGTIYSSRFVHDGAAAPANSMFDGSSAGSTAASYLTYKNCSFDTTGAAASSDISFGTSGCNNVLFEDCSFNSDNGREHVYASSATRFRMLRCASSGGAAALVSLASSNDVRIEECRSPAVSAGFGMYFTNTNRLRVLNNRFETGSVLSLTAKSLHVHATSDIEDILIQGNMFKGDGTNVNTLGCLFDIAGTDVVMSNVRVVNNVFNQLEVPFWGTQTSGTGGQFAGIDVSNNTMQDQGVDVDNAVTQKIAISFGAEIVEGKVCENIIRNINPTTTALIGGVGRVGILLGVASYGVDISDNSISRLGKGSYEVDTVGITTVALERSTIKNNRMSIGYGSAISGIRTGALTDCSIVNNTIGGFTHTTGNAMCGIQIEQATDSMINGNNVSSFYYLGSATTTLAGGIYISGGSGTYLRRCSIIGNKIHANTAGAAIAPGISCRAHHVISSDISGNTVAGDWYRGINVQLAVALGTFTNVSVVGNTVQAVWDGIILDAGSSTDSHTLVVSSNSINTTVPSTSIDTFCLWVNEINWGLVVSNNTLFFNDDDTCQAFGIKVEASEKLQIIHNVSTRYVLSGAALIGTGYHIEVPSGCDIILVAFNICNDENTTGTVYSIDTSGVSGVNGNIVGGNICDSTPFGHANQHPIALTATSPSPGLTGQSIPF